MLIDLARDAPATLETDVLLVGSGAAGLALALALDELGVQAIVLEAGGERFDKAGQEFYRAGSIRPDTHGPTNMYRRRGLGGTTAIWGGRCIPFDPIDFEDRAWIPAASWPIGYDEVAAYYPRATALCRAGAPAFDAGEALPKSPAPLVDGVVSADVVLDRIERFSEPTNFGRRYRRQIMASRRVTLVVNAPVTEILTDPGGGRCVGAEVSRPDGGTLVVTARRTVVAAGGIETPRLLLNSTRVLPAGVGNGRDLVGRFYQSHLEGEVGTIRFRQPARDVRLDYERSPDGIYCRRYIWLSPEAQQREKLAGLILRPGHPGIVDPSHGSPVLSSMYLVKDLIMPEYSRKLTASEVDVKRSFQAKGQRLLLGHLRNILFHPVELALFTNKYVRDRLLSSRKLPSIVLRDAKNAYPIDVNAEQTPLHESRVALSGERDSHGRRRIAIDYHVAEDDRRRVADGMRVIQAAFAASGHTTIDLPELDEQVAALSRIGGHHIGTARMAGDPAAGVVDRDCAVFGTGGLYVAGAAVFPTSGFANPTLTVVALALRLADHLARSPA